MNTIPLYTADGARLPNRRLKAIEKLLVDELVDVERNRRGAITCAYFRRVDGSSPIEKSAHMGQSYSFHEHLESGHRVWQFARLLDRTELRQAIGENTEQQEVDLFVRSIFRAVPLSVMTPGAQSAAQPVKSFSRPVEFDSELRRTA